MSNEVALLRLKNVVRPCVREHPQVIVMRPVPCSETLEGVSHKVSTEEPGGRLK